MNYKIKIFIYAGLFFTLLFIGSVKEVSASSVLFRSGFESDSGPVNAVLSDITGIDNSVSIPNDWNNLSGYTIGYSCGNSADRWAKIVDDPTQSGNKVLKFWLSRTEYCTANTRVQSNLSGGPTERYQRVRMYFHPDMLKLIGSGLSGGWFQFQEFWIRPNWTGVPNSFRISFYLERDVIGTSERFYWSVNANECCNGIPGQDGTEFWGIENKTIPVPVGEWFTAETYYKMGDNNNGRIIFTIQKDGGSKQVVADVTNWTYHPEEPARGIYLWSPHKLYVGPTLVDYVRDHGGVLQIYWDDWEIWDSMPNNPPANPYCGDRLCNNSETCSTCPADCGSCPVQYFLPNQYVQAEAGILSSMLTSTAVSDKYIYTATANAGSAKYAFNITAPGSYKLEARIHSSNSDSRNSFYVGLDSESVQNSDIYSYHLPLVSAFTWDEVNKMGNGTFDDVQYDPITWNLTSGVHTFTIYGREPNTWLDQIRLIPASSANTAPAAPTGVRVI